MARFALTSSMPVMVFARLTAPAIMVVIVVLLMYGMRDQLAEN